MNPDSFVKEQLQKGRDVVTIRNYLLSRNISPKEVDASFDRVYGANPKKKPLEKFVIAGLIFFIAILLVSSYTVYVKLTTTSEISPRNNVETSTSGDIASGNTGLTQPDMTCSNVGVDKKYDCYMNLFEKGEGSCYDIQNENEKSYCYRVHDYYILESA